MTKKAASAGLYKPAVYKIRIQSRLEANWSEWFSGMTISTDQDEQGSTVTVITGLLVDQVALHGLLVRISDLGLVLLSVERFEPGHTQM